MLRVEEQEDRKPASLMTLLNHWITQPWAPTELLQMWANTIFLLFMPFWIVFSYIEPKISQLIPFLKISVQVPSSHSLECSSCRYSHGLLPHSLQVSAQTPLPQRTLAGPLCIKQQSPFVQSKRKNWRSSASWRLVLGSMLTPPMCKHLTTSRKK